jgi:3-hydroxymyristoyl/3-hydroxydecanoyl-(acyl carrier protein) dehydratase
MTPLFEISGPEQTEPAERGRLFRIAIPSGSRLFDGHFPGRPILPGVAHLALVEKALAAGLSEVRSLKLRKPVEPGAALELLLGDVGEDGAVRFEIRGEGPVSQGMVVASTSPVSADAGGGALSREAGEGRGEGGAPPPLPHQPPARLITALLEASSEAVTCLAEIPLDHPLVSEGLAPAYLGLEAGAQAAAALEALGRGDGDKEGGAAPRIGYVVAIREARFRSPWLAAGRSFRVEVRSAGSAPPLAVYEVRAVAEGVEAVTGTVSTFLP